MALDVVLASWVAKGELGAFVRELEHDPSEGPVEPREFRRVQRDRLAGRLDDAVIRLKQLERRLGGSPPVRAACAAELGEIALIRGEYQTAMGLFAESARAWERASRASPRWAAEAARGVAASWIDPEGIGLDVGVAWATRRGLVGLEAILRLARGLCAARGDVASGSKDLMCAQELADGMRARLFAGRVRWLRCTLGLGDLRELERSVVELTGDSGWWSQAALALAESLDRADRARALQLAIGAQACFVTMGLLDEQARALAVIRGLAE
jgi:tetratricopeptide (TPR) repeat protein